MRKLVLMFICFFALVVSTWSQRKNFELAAKISHKWQEGQSRKFKDNLVFGTGFGIQIGPITAVAASPFVGYRIFPKMVHGIGFVYQYTTVLNGGVGNHSHSIGGRVFNNYYFLRGLHTHIEYEYVNFNLLGQTKRADGHSLNLGLGYTQFFGRNFFSSVAVLGNAIYGQGSSPYGSPIQVRVYVGF